MPRRLRYIYGGAPRGRKSSSFYEDRYKPVKASYLPEADAYKISFPFKQAFVDTIKATIPDSERSYDHEFKEWTIAAKYAEPLLELAKLIFPDSPFQIIDKKKVEEFNQGSTNTAIVVAPEKLAEQFFVMLEVAGLKPKRDALAIAEVKKDYLRASLFYHPDRNNGDGKNMSELNYLWQNLKGIYFK